jgi:ADP-ribose pyrophosphatase
VCTFLIEFAIGRETDMDTFEKFLISERHSVFSCPIFRVYTQRVQTPDLTESLQAYTLECADWVNIVPITPQNQIVMIEQHRFGTDALTLEMPGGAVDPGEKDTTLAAMRELEEETGLTTQKILALPRYSPNPALQNNKIFFFLALDVEPIPGGSGYSDPFERIKVHFVPLEEALQKARTGQVAHALSALALLLAEPYLKGRSQRQ